MTAAVCPSTEPSVVFAKVGPPHWLCSPSGCETPWFLDPVAKDAPTLARIRATFSRPFEPEEVRLSVRFHAGGECHAEQRNAYAAEGYGEIVFELRPRERWKPSVTIQTHPNRSDLRVTNLILDVL